MGDGTLLQRERHAHTRAPRRRTDRSPKTRSRRRTVVDEAVGGGEVDGLVGADRRRVRRDRSDRPERDGEKDEQLATREGERRADVDLCERSFTLEIYP